MNFLLINLCTKDATKYTPAAKIKNHTRESTILKIQNNTFNRIIPIMIPIVQDKMFFRFNLTPIY
jgi:hypothetical protein